MKSSFTYYKCLVDGKIAKEKIKEYKKNSNETMLKISEYCNDIATKYDFSLSTILKCEISIYEYSDVVHCICMCISRKSEKFSYGFIEMFFSLQNFKKNGTCIVKIFEKTQEHRNI